MKKLNLDELALKLPKIDEKNSKILLGGSYGNDDSAFNPDNTLNEGNSSNNQQSTNNIPDDYSDGNYDLDYSQDDQYQDADDYSYDQDGDVQNNGNSGNGTFTFSEAAILANFPESFSDGVNLSDYPIGFDNTLTSAEIFETTELTEQIMTILETNSVIAQFLNEIAQRGINLSFLIGDVVENASGNTLATTVPNFSQQTTTITIDFTDSNPDDGWADSSNADTAYESLVNTMLHEVFHARIAAIFQEAYSQNQDPVTAVLDHNAIYAQVSSSHGVDMANIYYNVNASGDAIPIGDNQTIADNHHAYMEANYNNEYTNAEQEFNDDIDELRDHLNDLQNDFQQKLNELTNTNWQVEDEQERSNLEQEVEALEAQINYIQTNYSNLLNN